MNINKKLIGKIIKVEWTDARTFWESMFEDDVKKEGLIKIETIGYVVDINNERISVSSMLFMEGDTKSFKSIHLVPRKMIKKIVILNGEKKEVK